LWLSLGCAVVTWLSPHNQVPEANRPASGERTVARPATQGGRNVANLGAETLYLGTAAVCACSGAICDFRSRRIPNWLTGSSILLGLALHLVLGGWHSIVTAALAGLVAGGAFLFLYLAGGMGGGDVKLITGVACCAGLSHVTAILIATALAGGIFALVLAVVAGRLKQTLSNVVQLLFHHGSVGLQPHPDLNVRNSRTLRLPYGVAIGAGTAMTLFGALLGQ
jgi:prepilin peptidase CpaA